MNIQTISIIFTGIFASGSCQFISSSNNDSSDVHFLLLLDQNTLDLTNRTFQYVNSKQKTVILLYGWLTSIATDQYVISVARKYQKENDYNVIYVDWSMESYNNYVQEVFSTVQQIGTTVGETVMSLYNVGVDVRNVHLIGFSLGAHVCGFASRYIRSHHPQNHTVQRITGLDPAGPLFSSPFGLFPNPYSLKSTDADVVDVLHSDGGLFGLADKIGTVDFYINGGDTQASCGKIYLNNLITVFTVNACSHVFAVLLYKHALNNQNYRASTDPNECKDVVVFGDKLDANSTGVYYIQTTSYPPYRTTC